MPGPRDKAVEWVVRSVDGTQMVKGGEPGLTNAHSIVLKTSNGGRIDIELWERTPNEVTIRVHDGQLVLEPVASNSITVRNHTAWEQEAERQAAQKKEKKRGNRK